MQFLVRGVVVGPTFHFLDCKKINFGTVSFDIAHTKTTTLVNTSGVDMEYRLWIPQDGTYVKKEFVITPSVRVLPAGASQEIEIVFTPSSIKVYDYTLAVDIRGVGTVIQSLPISAECIVSTVRLAAKELDFGQCFLRYPSVQELVVTNVSSVVNTKIDFLPQQEYSKNIAVYSAEPQVCVVPAGGSRVVTFTLLSQKLGNFKVPVVLNVAGSQEPPLNLALGCVSVGPKIVADVTELRWGNVDCLADSPRSFRLTNASLIPASVKLFFKLARSKFSMSATEFVMQPNEEKERTITANLDDTIGNDSLTD